MNNNPVPELIELLGGPAVLIGWPKGSKGEPQKWGHLNLAGMTPEYLAKLGAGNIGVALGEKSGGLLAIDIDDDALVEPFLTLNPALRNTFQTHGSRGRVFWIRAKGDYPRKTIYLKSQSGGDAGEIRSNGCQSIVWGEHPDTGLPYEFVVKKPAVEIEFNSIQWPAEIINPPHCTEENVSHSSVSSAPSVASVPSVASGSSVSSVHVSTAVDTSSEDPEWMSQIATVGDALRVSMPDRVHENNHCLFTLARAVKALEVQSTKFTPENLRDIFGQWHTAARRFLRPDREKEDYWVEFLNAYHRAKYPLGGATIPKAWKRARENPAPVEAIQSENPQLRLLVAFCRELQILNGENPFYLSSRTCQKLFGHENHTTAAKWLKALCALRIIAEVEKGNSKRATRYKYLGQLK